MKLRFWKQKQPTDKTILELSVSTLTSSKIIHVETQSSEKALELMEKLREKAKT